MSFARNFAMGQQIAQTALDTYERTRERGRLREIGQAKPTEIDNAYTSSDADQLRALAGARDAAGNPYYNLQANPDGSYGLSANFAYPGQGGQPVDPGSVAATFAPRERVVEFMGTRYAPDDLTPDRIDGLRARAMADVIAETDPARGLQLRQSIKSGERDDKRFAWEEQQQPLRQEALGLQVGEARRKERTVAKGEEDDEFYRQSIKEYTGAPEQIGDTAQYLNRNSGRITVGAPDKNGMVQLSVVKTDGSAEFLNLPKHQQAQLYAAGKLLERNPTRAMELLSGVNKELAAAVAAENGIVSTIAQGNNAVGAKNAQIGVDRDRLAMQWWKARADASNDAARTAATSGYYSNRAQMDRMGSAQYFTGKDGNTYASIPTMTKDGLRFETVRVNPDGVSMVRAGSEGASAKPTKVPEEGEMYTIGGRPYYSDGLGGWIPGNNSGKPAGVLPSRREETLLRAGVPQDALDRIRWNQDGTAVGINGMRFGLDELNKIPGELSRIDRNTIAVEEAQRGSMELSGALRRQREQQGLPASVSGFGPTITYRPTQGVPSIYAPQTEWEAYRMLQQGR